MNPAVLLDVHVLMDVLQRRQDFFAESAGALAAVETGRCRGFVAARGVTTLFYLMARHGSVASARLQVSGLLRLLRVATVDQAVVAEALSLPYADFEDAVQMAAAELAGCDYLVTRNVTDFAGGPVPVLLPGELLALLAE